MVTVIPTPVQSAQDGRREAVPKSKKLVSSNPSGSDPDREVEKRLKRKEQVVPDKPVKKQKSVETSRTLTSSKHMEQWSQLKDQISHINEAVRKR
ncbi:activated RNA polymerase II transcriptional coactivator p15-like [Meriones unguiculatus]|uniref:activated RNA polymerase II transcriptional coactivator p15-like n=1 Tax=Meriones unguiculatus TaxID=10047 RepID=UPI00293E9D6B|nr:activated RNA polymerase II transcriptional coactivator p15-like [Meriones unguiculatus]